MSMVDGRVPATILTGFLGSGKTTLLNHILTASHGKKIAIIENEFGDVAIDDALIAKNSKYASDEEIVEVLNGCICCTVRSDLIAVLQKLAARQAAGEICLDAIVIETTGMADPAPVAQTFLVDETIRMFARLDGIVTLVDAKHIEQHLDDDTPTAEGVVKEAAAQVAFADRILLNKVDLVSESDLERIELRLQAMNKLAPIQRCQHSEVSVDRVLNIHGFDLDRTLASMPDFLNPNALPTKHNESVTSVSLDQSAARHLRAVDKGALDFDAVKEWINQLLSSQGADLFRMKGVLSIAHAECKFVYHSVHMIFNGHFDEQWAVDGLRESKLVFIGKNLDAKALADGFNSCLATPESIAKKIKALRFAVGDEVECCVGPGEWSPGKVVAHMHREPAMPPGMVAPYQVHLDESGPEHFIWAPYDCDEVIRKVQPAAAGRRNSPRIKKTGSQRMS
eukprot:CAMPEP_0183350514 /NCGR_PEP_ID=MMETSP0164_2-20130417/19692_1 /TAXON_ID=221442 /ORGANISM="Coccolithus pelagicus ssp braarudi, Strain PLY182g" /LENGTH=451 /DNA_ID=CAMNT_0025522459 /DNA_START=74 /DNA_END=1429 /DNA_ORIENTATION=-